MSEDHYIASHSAEAFERERLGLLERVADPITLRRLQSLGVREGWRCLEIGAGHGSVARWLAKQVGPQGQVVATDLNPRFLRELAAPNIEVRHHDILNDELGVPGVISRKFSVREIVTISLMVARSNYI